MVKTELPASGLPPEVMASGGTPAPNGPGAGSEDLLLWAAACGLKPTEGWFTATGVTQEALQQLKQRQAPRLARLRLLRALGGMLGRGELELMLRARVVEQLLVDGGSADLERIARVVERLPASGAEPAPAKPGRPPAVEDDLAGMDLETAIAEARRLLSSLEEAPDDQA